MAAQEVKSFDLKFVKKETNNIYNNLINCVSIKSPYVNNSFRQRFTQSKMEQWDKDEFFVTKRKWFKKQKIYNRNASLLQEETDSERINWTCYDVCIVRWYRYFLYYNNKETKLRIYKQINVEKWQSENSTEVSISSGNIVNITKYNWKNYFPANKNIHKKFMLNTYVRWNPYSNWIWMWRIRKEYDSYFSELIDSTKEISCSSGDYIWTDTWLVHIVWKKNNTSSWQNIIELATSRAKVISPTWDVTAKQNIKYKVFKEYWLAFHFVTSDWLVHWHADNDVIMEYSFCWNLKFDTNFNTVPPISFINSISVYSDWTVLLNSLWWIFVSWKWFDKFFYSWLNVIQTTWVYWSLKEYMSNILLMWPNKIWYLIFDFNTGNSDIYELVQDWWTYSKESFWVQDNNFLYVRNTKDFYKLELSYWYWAWKPQIKMWYLSWFLNTDLTMLQKEINDINISISWNNNYLFIWDWWNNTKILFYDRYYNTRFKWFVTWCKIKLYKHWCFIWWWIFENTWNTDEWNDITQIVTALFWDRTKNARKHLDYIKTTFWYNSYVTEWDSIFRSRIYESWYEYDIKYSLLPVWWYMENIMKLKYDSENDIKEEFTLKNFPMWIELNSCEWVNVNKQDDTLTAEFDAYNNLWTLETKLSFENKYNISKVWFMKFPISQPCEIISFELIARWDNKIEFWWFYVWFHYYDNDFWRIEDTANTSI